MKRKIILVLSILSFLAIMITTVFARNYLENIEAIPTYVTPSSCPKCGGNDWYEKLKTFEDNFRIPCLKVLSEKDDAYRTKVKVYAECTNDGYHVLVDTYTTPTIRVCNH